MVIDQQCSDLVLYLQRQVRYHSSVEILDGQKEKKSRLKVDTGHPAGLLGKSGLNFAEWILFFGKYSTTCITTRKVNIEDEITKNKNWLLGLFQFWKSRLRIKIFLIFHISCFYSYSSIIIRRMVGHWIVDNARISSNITIDQAKTERC